MFLWQLPTVVKMCKCTRREAVAYCSVECQKKNLLPLRWRPPRWPQSDRPAYSVELKQECPIRAQTVKAVAGTPAAPQTVTPIFVEKQKEPT
jgi:hypothetical protein